MSNTTEDNNPIVELTRSPKLKESGLITESFYNTVTHIIRISFNHYANAAVAFTIDQKRWQNNSKIPLEQAAEYGFTDKKSRLLLKEHLNDNQEILVPTHQYNNNNKNDKESIEEIHYPLVLLEQLQQQKQKEEDEKEGRKTPERQEIEVITPSEALRKDAGIYAVRGTISSVSKVFRMISKVSFKCERCKEVIEYVYPLPVFENPKFIHSRCQKCKTLNITIPPALFDQVYINAIYVEIEDSEKFKDLETLPIYFFGADTENIRLGEIVIINGVIIFRSVKKKYYTYLYAKSVEYPHRQEFTLSRREIDGIKRFASNKFSKPYEGSVIDKLVSMIDPSIVENEMAKKAMLMGAVNTSEKVKDSEHIDGLFIGPPGTAKTKMLRRLSELVPGSSNAGGQYSTGKSLTAIIERIDDNIILRLGLIPKSRGAICTINELGRQPLEDQDKLLDVMEERYIPFDKYGIHRDIPAPTAIWASANPINKDKWVDDEKIDLNEFPFLDTIIDRFGLIITFSSKDTEEEIDEFADKLSEIEDKKDNGTLPDYTYFLIRYIQFAKKFNPALTDECRTVLTDFYKKIAIKGFGSPRVHITLPKLAKAVARLKLKDVADIEDAKEVIEFYNSILVKFRKEVTISEPLKYVAYKKGVEIVERYKASPGGISLETVLETICKEDPQLAAYFGYGTRSFKMSNNMKIRKVKNLLVKHSNIGRVSDKPVVLKWLYDIYDIYDTESFGKNNKNEKNLEESISSGKEVSQDEEKKLNSEK